MADIVVYLFESNLGVMKCTKNSLADALKQMIIPCQFYI